jgi:hypothetical protein
MESARLFYCVRCNAQVLVCRQCDRGQSHCSSSCSNESRRESVRQAGRRYQNTRQGRLKHADRMRKYRFQKKQKVTHHGSPLAEVGALLPVDTRLAPVARVLAITVEYRCRFCRRPCSEWLRRHFIKRRGSGVAFSNTRTPHYETRPP